MEKVLFENSQRLSEAGCGGWMWWGADPCFRFSWRAVLFRGSRIFGVPRVSPIYGRELHRAAATVLLDWILVAACALGFSTLRKHRVVPFAGRNAAGTARCAFVRGGCARVWVNSCRPRDGAVTFSGEMGGRREVGNFRRLFPHFLSIFSLYSLFVLHSLFSSNYT